MPRKSSLRSEVETLTKAVAELHEKEKSNMEEREAWKIKYDRLQERMKDVEAELKKFKKS